ncbi:MAG: bifunctional [glutamate--ammonia ligase]-adenylyl-L-tyrosine phosphorylase/[glutamate--ammonia-ligase] adenylyltransferase [Deltaproteobacteria bacterium]|nr:bifunctional [glutamate--ammonia ligase]-adenylyl-L-tyrosine phosphorylase/[glutamate--ammonia-ligase] adenylyltransferase [Deltaproteobacteria bacterium]
MKPANDIPKELIEEAKNKLNSFIAAAKKAKVEIRHCPEIFAVMKKIFAFSDFVVRGCIHNPQMLADLIISGDIKRRYAKDEYNHKLKIFLSEAKENNNLSEMLRCFRLREKVRIAWRDLAGWADLPETMADLSNFADACLEEGLSAFYESLCSEYGTPAGADGSQQYLVIFGMGKLGAHELNFSSDIDLIFAYAEAGRTKGSSKSITNEEFFVLLCRRLLNVIGTTTPDGVVFRVDMRLRPFGESGPLVMSFDNMEAYYQRHGREWERYAWIKARVVAGNKETGKKLLNRLKPFVFRRYLDFGVYESLRDMKHKISLEVNRKGMRGNVKVGPGGIREIEFFGQIFQLIRGGVVPVLQERSILNVLKILANRRYIPQDVCNNLTEAYEFLRNTEHRLQEFSDQQTHKIPPDPVGKARLAASMGFDKWEFFALELKRHMEGVHYHFNKLLATEDFETKSEKIDNELKDVWLCLIENDHSNKVLLNAGFDEPNEVLRLLEHLRNDPETRSLSNEGRRRLNKLIPFVLKEAGKSEHPNLTLNRIIDLIKVIERRTCYIALLIENPDALVHLVRLSNTSPWIVSFLALHPVLLDELLDARTLYIPPEKSDIVNEIRKKLSHIPDRDLEYQIEELCIFKQINILRVAVADVTNAIPLMRVSDRLTDIAETIINEILELTWNYLIKKHGKPTCLLDGKTSERGFVVIAYGKLGGIELGYGGDLDLVFLHSAIKGQTKGGIRSIDNSQFFARLGQRIIHILTAHTSAGRLYETDMRLRPSGSSGSLVCHIETFKRYQIEKAWTWEHQALVKARAVSGDIILARYFEQIRKEVLTLSRSKTRLQQEVVDMRERMRKELLSPEPGFFDLKQDEGGMVDIEFIVQYLVLLKSSEYNELAGWTDIVRLLETLIETKIVDDSTARFLKEAYLEYRTSAHRLSLQEKPAKVPDSEFIDLRENVKKIWKIFTNNDR